MTRHGTARSSLATSCRKGSKMHISLPPVQTGIPHCISLGWRPVAAHNRLHIGWGGKWTSSSVGLFRSSQASGSSVVLMPILGQAWHGELLLQRWHSSGDQERKNPWSHVYCTLSSKLKFSCLCRWHQRKQSQDQALAHLGERREGRIYNLAANCCVCLS